MDRTSLERIATRVREQSRQGAAPFYAYDTDALKARCREFGAIPWPDTAVHFATMANASPAFLKVVHDSGLNVFVNSVVHLETALSLGWKGEQIVYTASAMDEAAMRRAREAGALLNLDSLGQLDLFWRLFPGTPVGIRCNIGERVAARRTRAGFFLGKDSRLGLTVPEIYSLQGNPLIAGLHLYVGTDINDLAYFEECYRALADLAPLFPKLRWLDFGGGFGLPHGGADRFDFEAYGRAAHQVMNDASNLAGRRLKLILEPGRLLAGEAGYFVCRVNDVKQRDGRQLLGTNASSAQFPRPLFYPDEARHPVLLLSESAGAPVASAIYGCSTYSRDFLAREAELPPAKVGDLLVFGDAGAYCASAHTAFLGFPAAGEVFL